MSSPALSTLSRSSTAAPPRGARMRAARLYGVRDLHLDELPVPELGPGRALVRIRAVSICGSDLHYYREGRIGDSRPTEPLVLGHELAGEVVAIDPGLGAQTTGLRPGQCVAIDPAIACERCEQCRAGHPNLCPHVRFAGTPPTDGGLQDYLVWPAHLLYALPPGMSCETGALLEPLGIAIHATDLARIRLADTVAVLGAGPIGLLAIRCAVLSGAVRVFATDLRPERLAAARDFGAAETADAAATDIIHWLHGRTGGRGVDVVLECAGAAQTFAQAVEVVRPGGTVVLVGIPDDDRIAFGAAAARRKGVTIKLCRRMKHTYPRAIALAEAGLVDLSKLVSHRYPLDQVGEAFAALDRGAAIIKAMVTW
jgi:L-iditol 2-dehydrogenase